MFDTVIANHMLYYVPDLFRAILEVYRVLKPGGIFYCATNGNDGMSAYLHDALKAYDPSIDAFGDKYCFSLQNGGDILRERFAEVRMVAYADSLCITDTGDLIAWIESTRSMSGVPQDALGGLHNYFEGIRREKGSIDIPKEAGLFMARK